MSEYSKYLEVKDTAKIFGIRGIYLFSVCTIIVILIMGTIVGGVTNYAYVANIQEDTEKIYQEVNTLYEKQGAKGSKIEQSIGVITESSKSLDFLPRDKSLEESQITEHLELQKNETGVFSSNDLEKIEIYKVDNTKV